MQDRHNHRNSYPDANKHRGSQRSGHSSEHRAADSSADAPKSAASSKARSTDRFDAGSHAKTAAALCIASAFFGLSIEAVAELIARTNSEHPLPVFNVLASLFTLVSLATGAYAQTIQLRRWSQRVKRRLLVGFPVALITALLVFDNFFDKYDAPSVPRRDEPARSVAATATPEDTALIKSGWFGELQQDGLLVTVCSFNTSASETRHFSRRLFKPVSYATLTLINMGSPAPVILQSLEVSLHMDSGEEVPSLPVRPLLEQKAGSNVELLKRLTVPHTLTAGSMFSDIPVCQETNFPWARVTAVTVSLKSKTLTIPGRMMSASEKQEQLDHVSSADKPDGTNTTAEAWFKNL